jgi:acyl carrier protein
MSTQASGTVTQKVIEIASKQVDIPQERISLDSQFVADLGFDSLDFVEFVMQVEEEFDIIVPSEKSDTIMTIRDAVRAIEEAVSGSVHGTV